ncbi:MAG: Mth938-like domain-containing protein [Gammaproteobacteria bacterium]|nr:Mth938-like domain-containing protein [Gammaproteobacteria bacterium]
MLQADSISSKFYIKSYDNNCFHIVQNKPKTEEIIKKNNFYLSNEIFQDFDSARSFKELQIKMIENFTNIDMLIIGTGENQFFPNKEFYSKIKNLNFSVDFMNNPAASRTFNVLVNDERKVAVLMFVD